MNSGMPPKPDVSQEKASSTIRQVQPFTLLEPGKWSTGPYLVDECRMCVVRGGQLNEPVYIWGVSSYATFGGGGGSGQVPLPESLLRDFTPEAFLAWLMQQEPFWRDKALAPTLKRIAYSDELRQWCGQVLGTRPEIQEHPALRVHAPAGRLLPQEEPLALRDSFKLPWFLKDGSLWVWFREGDLDHGAWLRRRQDGWYAFCVSGEEVLSRMPQPTEALADTFFSGDGEWSAWDRRLEDMDMRHIAWALEQYRAPAPRGSFTADQAGMEGHVQNLVTRLNWAADTPSPRLFLIYEAIETVARRGVIHALTGHK